MAQEKKEKKDEGIVNCYCLSNNGHLHCPLSDDAHYLESFFNVQVRGEQVVPVGIDKSFVCKEERKHTCKHCPFK